MRKHLSIIGLILFFTGIVIEFGWRSESARNAQYDNFGPGFLLFVPGFVMILLGKDGNAKKFFGCIWLIVLFNLVGVIAQGLFESYVHVIPSEYSSLINGLFFPISIGAAVYITFKENIKEFLRM